MKRMVAVLMGIWLGVQLAAGYLAAPILFAHLPKMTAGNIAGELFGYVGWSGLVVWAAVYFCCRHEALRSFSHRRSYTSAMVVLLWVLLAVSQLLVTPVIVALKTGGTNWLLSLTGGSFAAWHGVSSGIYVVCSILSAVLVWRLTRFEWR